MAVNRDEKPFTILVDIGPLGQDTMEVDLSEDQYRKQVLAAAGRFRSLERKVQAGGRPPVPCICINCKEQFPSMAEFNQHICPLPAEEENITIDNIPLG